MQAKCTDPTDLSAASSCSNLTITMCVPGQGGSSGEPDTTVQKQVVLHGEKYCDAVGAACPDAEDSCYTGLDTPSYVSLSISTDGPTRSTLTLHIHAFDPVCALPQDVDQEMYLLLDISGR